MHWSSVILAAFLAPVSAWLPGQHKEILARDGSNLFNATSEYYSETTKRWLPASGKIRGVNLGSMFVFEPWIATPNWQAMGCGNANSEFDCVLALGQAKANTAFQNHWNTWITQADITQMQSFGLNTIRIPVGYWMLESLPFPGNEWFPQGGLAFLENVCRWAIAAGFYIIIDLHGAPGAQVAQNPDTGQFAPTPGFYVDWEFDRATTFLNWLTTQIHTNSAFANVGMLGIVNEPVQNSNSVADMRSYYYNNAYAAIRNAESALGITSNNFLHVQMMNNLWGSGDPTQFLTNNFFTAYDDHRYLKFGPGALSSNPSQSLYLSTSCSDNRGGNTPTIVGEFSLSVPDAVQFTAAWEPSTQQAFYKKWFAAQIQSYERTTDGWIFWTWKSQLGDYRWSYQDAVNAGVIPTNPQTAINMAVC